MTTAMRSAAPARQAGKATLATQVTSCFYCEKLGALNHVRIQIRVVSVQIHECQTQMLKVDLNLDPNAFKDQIDLIY